jgi:hypothetical protein
MENNLNVFSPNEVAMLFVTNAITRRQFEQWHQQWLNEREEQHEHNHGGTGY